MSGISARTASALRAAGYALAMTLVYAVLVCTPIGQRVDAATLGAFPAVQGDGWLALYGARDVIPVLLCVTVGILSAVAMVRRRITPAVSALALVAAVFALARALERLPRPDLGAFAYAHNTFPSGHTAVSLAAVVAIGWTAPGRRELRLMAVPLALAVAVAVFSLLSFAHRGSDVVGGALLTGAVASAISAISLVGVSGGSGRGGPRERARPRRVLSLAFAASAALVALAAVSGPVAQAPLAGTGCLLAAAAISVRVVWDGTSSARPWPPLTDRSTEETCG